MVPFYIGVLPDTLFIRVFATFDIKGTRAREISLDATPFLTPTKREPWKSIPTAARRRGFKTISNSSRAHIKNLLMNKVNSCSPVAINQGWFIRNDGFLDLFWSSVLHLTPLFDVRFVCARAYLRDFIFEYCFRCVFVSRLLFFCIVMCWSAFPFRCFVVFVVFSTLLFLCVDC